MAELRKSDLVVALLFLDDECYGYTCLDPDDAFILTQLSWEDV